VGFAQRVQGSAYLRSGKLEEAVAALQGARDRMRGQDGYALERGVLHTDLARALARSGKPDHAARMAIEARSILKAAGGEAPAALLAQFDREFPPTR
ncbi:MAG: hypothetical protein JKY37_10470, partial [Nannocystaceae bacterium]|nr:hypothetical protein [Nannocystaceae bacterium]